MNQTPETSLTTTLFYIERHRPQIEELIDKIKLCAKDATESSLDALESAISAGGHLIKAKERILYGKWGKWLSQNFEFSQSVATGWMRLWEHRVDLRDLVKDAKQPISVADALRLVSKQPNPVTKTKLQKVKKRCVDLIREIHDQNQTEAKRSREVLIEHIKNVNSYIKTYT